MSADVSRKSDRKGFERFFEHMGTPADAIDPDSPPFVPDFPRMAAAAQAHNMEFMPDELDLYLPPEPTGRVPVVVFFHGGGWRLGSRRSAGPALASARPGPFERVAAAGIAVAGADYRLSGEAVWPAQLHDAKAAVRWLRARADEAGLNPERIAVWGESAGGHLAALVGLTGTDLDGGVGIVGPPATVSAVAAWYAPSDLAALPGDLDTDPMDPGTREAQLIGGPLATLADRARETSPIDYLHADAPPFLLRHERADRLIPWIGAFDAAEQVLTETIEFLRHQLKPR